MTSYFLVLVVFVGTLTGFFLLALFFFDLARSKFKRVYALCLKKVTRIRGDNFSPPCICSSFIATTGCRISVTRVGVTSIGVTRYKVTGSSVTFF